VTKAQNQDTYKHNVHLRLTLMPPTYDISQNNCVAHVNLTYFTHIVSAIFNFVLCTFSTPLPFCHFHQFVFMLRGWYGVRDASNRSCWKTSLPVCI